jgi:hypothetical protein
VSNLSDLKIKSKLTTSDLNAAYREFNSAKYFAALKGATYSDLEEQDFRAYKGNCRPVRQAGVQGRRAEQGKGDVFRQPPLAAEEGKEQDLNFRSPIRKQRSRPQGGFTVS